MIEIKTGRAVRQMKKTGALAAKTLEYLVDNLRQGMSTLEIDDLAYEYITKHGARPAPLHYNGYPKSICVSRNEVVCHGIPSAEEYLLDGDIVNIDVTTLLEGYHGDMSCTVLVGNVSKEAEKLVQVTRECLYRAIDVVRPGATLGDIGAVISTHAHAHGYSVVEDYCGHGIGRDFHEEPQVVHTGVAGEGVVLKEGMTFTIEPMINAGSKHTRVVKDGWRVETRDQKLSAQFEHTLLVTTQGVEILTPFHHHREEPLLRLV